MKLKNRILMGILTGTIMVSNISMSLFAAEVPEQTPLEVPEAAMTEEEVVAAAYAAPVDSNSMENWPQGPAIGGESGIVMDINSGAILYAKGIDEQHFPASITKVLTSLVALENSKLTDKVKFTEDSISFLEYGDAQIGMIPGEELSMDDALHAVLLASANEVSHAVAENVGSGGYDAFIQKMNDRAKELGCLNSHFVNPHGLHDDNHYTSARDMALIASAAFKIPEFREITKTLEYSIAPTSLQPEVRIFQQNHKMLYEGNVNYYEYCVGGKTGFTDQALTTLVTFAEKGDMQLVAVNLKTHGPNVYQDTRGMLDYVFDNFSKVTIKGNQKSEDIAEVLEEDAYVVIPNSMTLENLESKVTCSGTRLTNEGRVTYSYVGQYLGSAKITASEAYFDKLAKKAEAKKKEDTKKGAAAASIEKKSVFPKWTKVLIIVLVGCGAIFFIIQLEKAKARRNRRRRRNRSQKSSGNYRY